MGGMGPMGGMGGDDFGGGGPFGGVFGPGGMGGFGGPMGGEHATSYAFQQHDCVAGHFSAVCTLRHSLFMQLRHVLGKKHAVTINVMSPI